MSAGTWRDHARHVVVEVMSEHGHLPIKELRKKLQDAYPFGQRAYHPYNVWLQEVRKALAAKMPPKASGKQMNIFGEEVQA